MTQDDFADLLYQYNIDTSSKTAAYMSSDYLKDETKYGIYDFSMFFYDLGLEVDFDTRKEGEFLMRYFLAAMASFIIEDKPVNFEECLRASRIKTDEMMQKLGLVKNNYPVVDSNGKKVSLKKRALKMHRDNPQWNNSMLIKNYIKDLQMTEASAKVYASMVKTKWSSE